MDIKITMTDENGHVVDELQIYQDGSDCDGCADIRELIEVAFTVEPDDEDDGQPDEAQEWHDYDPDC